MRTTDLETHPLDRAGAGVDVRWTTPQEIALVLATDPWDRDARSAADVLCEAVSRVRGRDRRRVHTAVDASGASGGIVLDALRARIGTDVESIALRRAGSSVMVTLDLLPRPASPRPPRARTRTAPGHTVPQQAVAPQRPARV